MSFSTTDLIIFGGIAALILVLMLVMWLVDKRR
jgi:hypothetical protein